MRQALQGVQAPNRVTGTLRSAGAPVGGLNARDSLSAMKPEDALILDNFVCRATTVDLRKGQIDHVTGFGATEVIECLMSYRAAPNDRMFAASDLGIYDVTTHGMVGAKVSPCTQGRWEYMEGGNAGLHYLLMVNSVDPMKLFNGTTWSDATITGVDSKTFSNITNFKNRAFMCQKDTLVMWYLDVGAVQGAAHAFDLSSIFMKGGSLLAILNWTIDGGSGADDYCVILSTEGEVAVYKGTDISNAATWGLVGLYSIPRPIGRRSMFKFGGDVIIISESGLVKLSSVLQAVAVDRQVSVSDKIIGLLNSAATLYKANLGWQLVALPSESLLILNVPVAENVTSIQYVMNTLTGAWSSFSAMNANCFLELGGRLFYGMKGKVVQALVGTNDFGANITAKAKTSFNAFGSGGLGKKVNLIRVNYRTSKNVSVGLAITINYDNTSYVTAVTSTPQTQSLWDNALWDTGRWADSDYIVARWRSVAHKPGYVLSTVLQVSDKDFTFSWNNTDYLLGTGFGL